MLSKNLLFAVTAFFVVIISNAQKKRNIYLGEGMDTLFEAGTSKRTHTDKKYILLEFLGYQTFSHGPVSYTSNEDINRVGLVLPAKRTEYLEIKAEAVVGKNENTCLIVYDAAIEKITKGRSAFVSVMNLFSRQEDKSPQEDPSSHLRKVKVTGKISLNDTIVDFIYENNFNRDYNLGGLSGKLWYRGDSLTLQPLKTYHNKKGKKKKGYIGYSLKKGDVVYAAADTYNDFTFYINKSIGQEERLLISAYLFIVVCYFYYPPFVDMTPT